MDQTVWVIRAGSSGENEELVLASNRVGLDYGFKQDLAAIGSREELKTIIQQQNPDYPPQRTAAYAGALWRLKEEVQPGQVLLLPLKTTPEVAVGRFAGPYQFMPDRPPGQQHTRAVAWQEPHILRSALRPELLRQLNSYSSLFAVGLTAEDLPVFGLSGEASQVPTAVQAEVNPYLNFSADAKDAIRRRIGEVFREHLLEELVEDILKAQGFHTLRQERRGSDGGRDVVASHGPLGMGSPRICVEVKSGKDPIGRPIVDQLMGVMGRLRAELGLFVSWSGYRRGVREELRDEHHRIRLWDQDQLIAALLENYDRLPLRSKSKIPLKQLWVYEPSGELEQGN